MATEHDVDRTLKALVRRLNDAEVETAGGIPQQRSIACVIRDLGLEYRGDFKHGKMNALRRTEDGTRADIVIRLSSDDLIALAEGRMSVTMALFTGKLRVDAAPSDLMLLRRLF